jgi:hypothetical protein
VIDLKKFRAALANKPMPPPPDSLSFVTKRKPRGTGYNYWNVKPTDSYEADCEAGSALADEYLAFIGAHPTYGNATLLTCIVGDMIDQAKAGASWSGLHVGFLGRVNLCAMAMAKVQQRSNPAAGR